MRIEQNKINKQPQNAISIIYNYHTLKPHSNRLLKAVINLEIRKLKFIFR